MIELIGDRARKRGDARALELEERKTRAAHLFGNARGTFYTPAVLHFDRALGVLETERILGFTSLAALALRRAPVVPSLMARVGAAIAGVHDELALSGGPWPVLPGDRGLGSPATCVIHGDLNGSNVGFDRERDRIVILDWSTAPRVGVPAVLGSRHFDLMWFCLFFFRFRPPRALLGWSPETWSRSFLDGYARASLEPFDLAAFLAYELSARAFVLADLARDRRERAAGATGWAFGWWQQRGWRRWLGFLDSLESGA